MTGAYPLPSDPTSVMGRRTLAWLADGVLWFCLLIAVVLATTRYETVDLPTSVGAEACDVLRASNPEEVDSCFVVGDEAWIAADQSSGAMTLFMWGYLFAYPLFQGIVGASPGKLLFGLRVVDRNGTKAGIGRSFGRTAMWIVDGAPWFIPLVGPIVGLTSTGHRRVGDMAAGTYVIRASDVGHPVVVGAAQPTVDLAWGAPPPPSPSIPAPPVAGATPAGGFPPSVPTEVANQPVVSASTAPDGTDTGSIADGSGAASAEDAGSATGLPSGSLPMPPPQWDPARNTYLQWEPNDRRWLQWDPAAGRWKPIDT